MIGNGGDVSILLLMLMELMSDPVVFLNVATTWNSWKLLEPLGCSWILPDTLGILLEIPRMLLDILGTSWIFLEPNNTDTDTDIHESKLILILLATTWGSGNGCLPNNCIITYFDFYHKLGLPEQAYLCLD